MLSWIAATTGGIIKDITVAAESAFNTVVEEVSSVPEAFSMGYDHGLFTGPDLEELDHHIDVEEITSQPSGPTFKAKAA
jgi:hypothetical protein